MKIIYLVISFFVALNVYANNLQNENIDKYIVDVVVHQSGMLDITETIDYNFNENQKHGIYRNIPSYIRGESSYKDIKITDINALQDNQVANFETYTENDDEVIKIGSADVLINGKHTYQISYKINKGILTATNDNTKDAIQWNAIGVQWEVPIENIQINVLLPHSLHQNNVDLQTYTGVFGSIDDVSRYNWLNPSQLQISINSLNPFEGVTFELSFVRGLLEQNGYENTKTTIGEVILDIFSWILVLCIVLYIYFVVKKYLGGFKDRRAIAVQYNPPKGFTLLKSGLVIDKFADDRDFTAAIIELAYLGYIRIEEENEKKTTLYKTNKEDTALEHEERYLLNEVLFKDSDKFVFPVQTTEVRERVIEGFRYINKRLYQWFVDEEYVVKNPQTTRRMFLIFSIITGMFFFVSTLIINYTYLSNGIFAGVLFSMILFFLFAGFGLKTVLYSDKLFMKILGYFLLILAIIMAIIVIVMKIYEPFISVLTVLGCMIILVINLYAYKEIGKFTQKGANRQKHLLGLKRFLKRVKKDEIERMLKEDSTYLDKMLPYAILFDYTKHWMSFYDHFEMQTPYWYRGNFKHFNHMTSTMSNASSSSSGGSGGSSGGGAGGGGGGSW